jgi:hypothetical protein
MRGLALVALAACSSSDTLPEATELEASVTAFDIDGDTVYWTTEFNGDLILKQRTPNSSGEAWRRSLDGFGASQILAGPDGIILAEGASACTHLTWIHRDRSSEVMPLLDGACFVYLRDQRDGAVIFTADDQRMLRMPLGGHTAEPWLELENEFFGEVARTDTDFFAFLGTSSTINLVRFPRGEPPATPLETLATNVGFNARSLIASHDAVYWFDPGGGGQPIRVLRAPRDGSSPPVAIYTSDVAGSTVPTTQAVSSIAWVEQPVWFVDDALWLAGYYELHRLEPDGTLATFSLNYNPDWIVAYAGQLVVLTTDDFGRYRLLLQPLH